LGNLDLDLGTLLQRPSVVAQGGRDAARGPPSTGIRGGPQVPGHLLQVTEGGTGERARLSHLLHPYTAAETCPIYACEGVRVRGFMRSRRRDACVAMHKGLHGNNNTTYPLMKHLSEAVGSSLAPFPCPSDPCLQTARTGRGGKTKGRIGRDGKTKGRDGMGRQRGTRVGMGRQRGATERQYLSQ
jgi:hypothetical protein